MHIHKVGFSRLAGPCSSYLLSYKYGSPGCAVQNFTYTVYHYKQNVGGKTMFVLIWPNTISVDHYVLHHYMMFKVQADVRTNLICIAR